MDEKKTWGARFSSLRAWICAVHERRSYNSQRYPMTNRLLLLLYPIFIVCMAELNQDKYPSKLVLFIAEHPTIMLFNVLIAGLIFGGLLLIFRSGWIASAVESVIYMALSITELFKYNTNGNHLIMTDMKLFRSVKSLTAFAYIKITPRLLIYLGLCVLCILILFWFNPRIEKRMKLYKRLVPGFACLVACIMVVTVPAVSRPVYALFQVDTKMADNTFILNEKFENNGFLAFFMQTGSENLSNQLEEPEEYDNDNSNAVVQYLAADVPETAWDSGVKPNVIEIMSESYADFRAFSEELEELGYGDIQPYYDSFDKAAECYDGTLITPTYASYTVRTEFELLFGLPVKSLNDPNMPQRTLLDRQQPTVPAYYKSWGYNTAYVHPYLSSFYNRNSIYANFRFDTMIFEDDFTVPVSTYGEYIDDDVIYNQIESMLAASDEPLYLHTTTMQNHQPYSDGDSQDEFVNYLGRISHSTEKLAEFLDRLQQLDEPTIVFFVGDHYPSLRGDDGIYSQLGITSENCDTLYQQHFLLWSNYALDTSVLAEHDGVSMFYWPYLLMELIDAPRDSFTQTMINEMETEPVYSTNYMPMQEANAKLDILTYDRILGDIVSPSALDVLPEPTEDQEETVQE